MIKWLKNKFCKHISTETTIQSHGSTIFMKTQCLHCKQYVRRIPENLYDSSFQAVCRIAILHNYSEAIENKSIVTMVENKPDEIAN